MKKILSIVLFVFLLIGSFNYVNAFDQNKVDLSLEKIENKISKKDLKVQINIYKKVRNKLAILKIKHKEWKNKELIEYLYSEINKKYKKAFKNFVLSKKEKWLICSKYECLINWVINSKNIQWNILTPFNFLFQSVHWSNKIAISFDNEVIRYKNILISSNISEEDAIIKIKEILKEFTEKEPSKEDIQKWLLKSIDSLNQVIGYWQECSFNISKKQQFIDVLNKWNEWKISSKDLEFADCNTTKDNSIKKITNKYKEEKLKKEKEQNELLKDKYSEELDKIKVEFLNFKVEYNIWENVEWEISILNIPKNYIAIISNWKNDFYRYLWNSKLEVYENGGYSSNKSYYDFEGKKNIIVNIYSKDLIWEDDSLFFNRDKLNNNSNIFKTFNKSFLIVNNPNKKFINWKEVDNSYEELWNGLFNKENKIYNLDRDNNYIEIYWLTKWNYKVFDEFIYTWENLYFEKWWKYEKVSFLSDFDSFELIYWEYYKDNNNIYHINDFHKKVTKIGKWNIINVNEWCFDQFLIVDNILYQAGNGSWDSCSAIIEKYSNYEFKNIN